MGKSTTELPPPPGHLGDEEAFEKEKQARLDASLVAILEAYRKLSMQSAQLELQMKPLKEQMMAIVEARGSNWQDEHGYVRVVDKAPAPTYSSTDVEDLASSWLKSNDPIMQSCGQMLLTKRRMSAGSHYVQIR